ncbi:NADPH:quinone oxidoreductase family protein [Pararhizobium haloflavum]|uniref:NADPH:quinone oxidoreductase family protein n=1 Tax=Pararhizobium haloflavum TaxID=2037914 RepID=UPI000C1A202F|nr:NADPH:quinone oxidoreductase family protein [Pararhizobium haloflavum]
MSRAIVCREFGPIDQLAYDEIDLPAPGPNEVVIASEAAGVNYPDGLLVKGLYQVKPPTPFVPGMETAGTVVATGTDVKTVSEGDRVVALLQHGGYAERVLTDARNVIRLPDAMPAADACALLCAYGTAHHALKQRAQLWPKETLVVLGAAGSTGLAAVQIGKAMGARVIAVASSKEKRALAAENGADEAIGYDNLKDALKERTDGKGADVVFDPVGGDAFDAASRAMARNGRLLVVGFASGRIPKLAVNLTLVKEYSVVGVFWGNFTAREPDLFSDNMQELFAWHAMGRVRPHIEGSHPLADAPNVLERILDRGTMGKSILVP